MMRLSQLCRCAYNISNHLGNSFKKHRQMTFLVFHQHQQQKVAFSRKTNTCNASLHKHLDESTNITKYRKAIKKPMKEPNRPYYTNLRNTNLILTSDDPTHIDPVLSRQPYLSNVDGNIAACTSHDLYLMKKQRLFQNISAEYTATGGGDEDEEAVSDDSGNMEEDTLEQYENRDPRNHRNFTIHNRAYSVKEWDDFVSEVLSTTIYSRNVVRRSILQFLLPQAHEQLASACSVRFDKEWHHSPLVKSFLAYLIENEEAFEKAQPVLITYFRRCLAYKDHKTALELWSKIKDRIIVYNDLLIRILINIASEARDDMMCYELYKTHLSYSQRGLWNVNMDGTFILSPFRNNDPESGIRVIIHEIQETKKISNTSVQSLMEYCRYTEGDADWKNKREIVESFFNCLHMNNVYPSIRGAHSIANWFTEIRSEKWSVGWFSNSDVSNSKCPISNVQLAKGSLDEDAFGYLKHVSLQSVVKQSHENLHFKYINQHIAKLQDNPKALYQFNVTRNITNFLEYLLENGPFDLIVDGMNMLYLLADNKRFYGKQKFKQPFLRLSYVVKEYLKIQGNAKKKVCVILQKHLYHEVLMDGKSLLDVADIYFSKKGISDDTFILYGSMCSGPDCYFASQDLFRNYRAQIEQSYGSDFTRLFDKYQRSRQVHLVQKWSNVLSKPISIDIAIQKTDTTWHFPVSDNSNLSDSRYPQDWLCITKGKVPSQFKHCHSFHDI